MLERKKPHLSPKCQTHEASMFPSLKANTVNQQLSAEQCMGHSVAGIWNDKSCRQRLVNLFNYLQPNSHTIQRNWFCAAHFCTRSQALLLALLKALPRVRNHGKIRTGAARDAKTRAHRAKTELWGVNRIKPTNFISISQFPSAFYPVRHIRQQRSSSSYLHETSNKSSCFSNL